MAKRFGSFSIQKTIFSYALGLQFFQNQNFLFKLLHLTPLNQLRHFLIISVSFIIPLSPVQQGGAHHLSPFRPGGVHPFPSLLPTMGCLLHPVGRNRILGHNWILGCFLFNLIQSLQHLPVDPVVYLLRPMSTSTSPSSDVPPQLSVHDSKLWRSTQTCHTSSRLKEFISHSAPAPVSSSDDPGSSFVSFDTFCILL